jgi:hypothetical protein
MIQLTTLSLLLAAGLCGSAWAQTPAADPSPPVAEAVSKAPQTESAQPKQQDEQARTYYVWDRVGKPIGKESFLI